MKAVIKEALRLCSNMWNVDSKQVINNRCRKADEQKKQELEQIKVELNNLKK